jgi:hypothetical protein
MLWFILFYWVFSIFFLAPQIDYNGMTWKEIAFVMIGSGIILPFWLGMIVHKYENLLDDEIRSRKLKI